jgi:hypothetical protein
MYETITAENLEVGMQICGLGKVKKLTVATDGWGREQARVWFEGGKNLFFAPNRKLYAKIQKKQKHPWTLRSDNPTLQQILRGLRR